MTAEDFAFCYTYNINCAYYVERITDRDKVRYNSLRKCYEGLSIIKRSRLLRLAFR